MRIIKNLSKKASTFIFSSVLQKAIPFLLVPFYTKYLSLTDYGIIGSLNSIFSIITIYITLKPSLLINAKYSQLNKSELRHTLSSFLAIIFASFILLSIILSITLPIFFEFINWKIAILVSLLALSYGIIEIHESLLIHRSLSIKFLILQTFRTIIPAIGGIYAISQLKMNWTGRYYPDVFAHVSISIFSIIILLKTNLISLNSIKKEYILSILKFSTPLTFHVLGLVLMQNIDRIQVVHFIGAEENGIYTLGYTIGALVGVFHESMARVWTPIFYKKMSFLSQEIKSEFVKWTYLYFIGSLVVLALFLLTYNLVFDMMVDMKFNNSRNIIPLIAIALTIESLRKIFVGHLYILEKVKLIAFITLFTGMLNFIMNIIFIPYFGITGAAYTTILSYLIATVVTIFIVQQKIKFQWIRN